MSTANLLRPLRRAPWAKRLAVLGLLGLQVSVAASPLLESNRRSLVSHVEQDGTSHHFVVHDEAKCAACSARSLHAAPAIDTPVQLSVARQHVLPVRHTTAVRSWASDRANPSRAPPLSG